jgi:hypothetical protein
MSQFYPLVEQPLTGPAAFGVISETAAQPQAAILLHLGRQLRGETKPSDRRIWAAAPTDSAYMLGLEDPNEFPVPHLPPRAGGPLEARERQPQRYGRRLTRRPQSYQAAAERVYATPAIETAAELLELCLDHPRDLVKIAAAHAYFPLAADPARCIARLMRGLRSGDALERDLAATALARIRPDHPALRRLTRGRRQGGRPRPAHTLTLVHGTWASTAEWYQPPSGGFFTYVQGIRSDLYAGSDFFSWTGGYSDGARAQAAVDLHSWVQTHHAAGLDVMGHSHGANVILRATQLGLTAGKLVLLSCPVHTHKYLPDFANVQRPVYSVRVKLDLVILADGGGQKFDHPDIEEVVLPVWFDHGASHEPAVWQRHSVAAKVSL